MTWTGIRLELARTAEHPEGSSRHVYLLHLPLDAEGLIDETLLRGNTARAVVHRHWGDDHPRNGYVVPTSDGWAISYERGESDNEPFFHLERHRLRPGDYLTITDTNGESLPMRVASAVALVNDQGETSDVAGAAAP